MSHSGEKFTIRYAGLVDGLHSFDFHPDTEFFTSYYSESGILASDIHVHIDADRRADLLIAEMALSGSVTVECDRCLDSCSIELSGSQTLFFSSSVNNSFSKKEEDSVVHIADNTDHINLDSHIYDFVMLSLPLRKVHDDIEGPESQCNQEVTMKLSHHSTNKSTDPRWDKLNEIKFDN